MLRSNEISGKWNFEIRMETAALHLTKMGNVETSSRHGMAIARTQMEWTRNNSNETRQSVFASREIKKLLKISFLLFFYLKFFSFL